MDFDQLQTFLAVLEHGSFSRAGQALRIGQSTVSFHVKALETAVGARLLDRGGGRVDPTTAGEALRAYAVRLVSLRDEALGELRSVEAGVAGHVSIAASTIPAEYLLPPVLAPFLRAHPSVSVRVDVSDSRRAVEALLARHHELGIVGTEPRDKRLVASAFADDEIVLVGRPELVGPAPLDAEALGRVRLVVREEGSGTRGAIAGVLAKTAGSRATSTVQVGSNESAKRCALEGVGLAFTSRRAVEEELAAGRLVVAHAAGMPVRRRFWVTRLRTETPSGAAKALRDALVRHYRPAR